MWGKWVLYGGRAWGCEEMLGVGLYVMQNMRVCMGGKDVCVK